MGLFYSETVTPDLLAIFFLLATCRGGYYFTKLACFYLDSVLLEQMHITGAARQGDGLRCGLIGHKAYFSRGPLIFFTNVPLPDGETFAKT